MFIARSSVEATELEGADLSLWQNLKRCHQNIAIVDPSEHWEGHGGSGKRGSHPSNTPDTCTYHRTSAISH